MICIFMLVTGDRGKMMAHGESWLVSRVKRAGHERRHVDNVSRCRCVDLDFSILEIEMMRHNRSPPNDEPVTQPTVQVGKGIT